MPAQHRHAPGLVGHGFGFTLASYGVEKSAAPCPLHGAQANPQDSNGSAPCDHGNCPGCPCPCCPAAHFAIGVLPAETARAAYAPPSSPIAAPPALLGQLARFAAFAAQPRAPPILI